MKEKIDRCMFKLTRRSKDIKGMQWLNDNCSYKILKIEYEAGEREIERAFSGAFFVSEVLAKERYMTAIDSCSAAKKRINEA